MLSHNKTVNNTIHSLLFESLFFHYENDACLKNEVCARKSMTLSREVIEDGLLDKSFWLIYNLSRTFLGNRSFPHKTLVFKMFYISISRNFIFVFPCIITLYYIKNQLDATLAVLFISHCKITLHVSDAFCVHHQEY